VGLANVPSSTPVTEDRPLSAWSNLDLIIAVSDGSDPAFAELYRRHKSEIFTYCLRMMSGDEDAASDLFQEVFIRAYEKAGQFRAGTNVTGWLFMIARNMCLNTLRTKRPCERIDLHPTLASSDRSLAPEYDEEQHFLRERLEEALKALPIDFREAFMLREFDGFSYSEIATMTGTTLAMTKVRIYRAKQRMRELLAPYLAE
jgi:RNA polymerase sigma-70 factor (ECF subfamily)